MIYLNEVFKVQVSLYLLIFFTFFCFNGLIMDLRSEIPTESEPIGQSQSSASNMIFRPGDAVEVQVFPDTASFLHNIFPIDGKGYVFLPIVGRTQISAMSETEFVSYLNKNFSPYLRTTDIQVRPMIRASLLGGFARPNLYYVDPNQTLWELVMMAGGTLGEEGLKKMKWERNKKIIADDLIAYYQSGRSLSELGFKSGDQLWTPTPDRPNALDRFLQYGMPLITLTITVYFFWYTINYGYMYGGYGYQR